MRKIYFLGQNKSVVLYTYRNQIFRATLDGGQMMRPVLLVSDFFSELSDVSYRGTVYYSYINRNREIIVKSIVEHGVEYKVSDSKEHQKTAPVLAEWQGKLLLCYLCYNRNEKIYQLKIELPFEEDSFFLTETYQTKPVYWFEMIEGRLFLIISSGEKRTVYLSEQFKVFSELKTDMEWFQVHGKQRSVTEEQLEYTRQLENKIRAQDALLESVKSQYADLMDTAIQYREEAKKWRGKYLRNG